MCAVALSKPIRLLLGIIAIAFLWAGAIAWTQRSRTIEGTWINLFEGSKFFEAKNLSQSCGPAFWHSPWLAFYPSNTSKVFRDLDTASRTRAGSFVSAHGEWPVTAYRMKFIGHKRGSEFAGLAPILGVGYGHLSASGSEFEVERLISIEELPNVTCDVR